MQVRSEPLINDSWNVLRFLGARRCLPVRVGRSSSAEQSTGPRPSVFFVEASRLVASGAGVVEVAEAEGPTAKGALTAACVELGDAEIGTEYPAGGGDGFDRTAKPLLVPLMINVTATASTIMAPNTSARRAQYVCAGSGPTGCSRPLMQPSLGRMSWPRPKARRLQPDVRQAWTRIARRRAEESEETRLLSPSADEVGGSQRAIRSEQLLTVRWRACPLGPRTGSCRSTLHGPW